MSKRAGFTLIEVMVAVMIISVVITALLELQSNTTKSFSHLREVQKNLQYASLLQGTKYGYENDSLTLERLVARFDLDDNLRRELKSIKASILYQKLDTVDTSELEDADEANIRPDAQQTTFILEIGRTVLQLPNGSTSLVRIRIP